MRRPVTGEVRVQYGQIFVDSKPLASDYPELSEAFAGQTGGLCGAAVPGVFRLMTGLRGGGVGFVVEVHDEAPALGPDWEDVVEVSFRPASAHTSLVEWGGGEEWDLSLARTDYRVRYCARGMDEGNELGSRVAGKPQADSYLLQFWPAPPGPDRVVRQTSEFAAHRHREVRELLPLPEQRAETKRLAQQAEERAAEERRLHYERWEWGGRLPSEGLRGVRESNVLGLLRFDSALVHALDAAGPEVQRAVALLAARRACEVSCLTDVPWVAQALTALTEGRPLPPPFDDWDRAFATLRSDSQVPERMVRVVMPPERPPYRPATPAPGLQHEPVEMGRTAGTPHGPHETRQPHAALPAVFAAAEPDPLKAALDSVWAAVNAYGEHYPKLLEEIRSACTDRVEG